MGFKGPVTESSFIKKGEAGIWFFTKGKYMGKSLGEVAEIDIGYLEWVHRDASDNFSDEQFYELAELLEKCGGDTTRKK